MNPVISCGSIMNSPQAEVFGFTNPLIGLPACPILIAAGVSLLTLPRPEGRGFSLCRLGVATDQAGP